MIGVKLKDDVPEDVQTTYCSFVTHLFVPFGTSPTGRKTVSLVEWQAKLAPSQKKNCRILQHFLSIASMAIWLHLVASFASLSA
jgi:hypothetical protein